MSAPVVHLMTEDLLDACGASVPAADGFHHLTPVAADVTCPACLEWVHA